MKYGFHQDLELLEWDPKPMEGSDIHKMATFNQFLEDFAFPVYNPESLDAKIMGKVASMMGLDG